MKNSFLYTGTELIVVVNDGGKATHYTMSSTHGNFAAALKAVKESRFEDVPALMNVAKGLVKYVSGTDITFDPNTQTFSHNGKEVHNYITDRAVQMFIEGFDIAPLVKHLNRLNQNPSARAVKEEYKFLEVGKLPITEDGCFLAYKRVDSDFMDIHSSTVKNKPAELMTKEEKDSLPMVCGVEKNVTVELVNGVVTVSMPRNQVDDEKNRTCSNGLHFCSWDYTQRFGSSNSPIVILKIDPADVVSIPADYNDTKGRCCRYQVVGVYVPKEHKKSFDQSVTDIGAPEKKVTESTVPVGVVHQDEYITGYKEGFKDGRHGNWFGPAAPYSYDMERGYEVGFRDSKNHRKRKF